MDSINRNKQSKWVLEIIVWHDTSAIFIQFDKPKDFEIVSMA